MKKVLITGGSGFFGQALKRRLLQEQYFCVNVDIVTDQVIHPNLNFIQADVGNIEVLENIFSQCQFDIIFHCAALLAHSIKDRNLLWRSNVGATLNIAECAKKYGVSKVVFISTSCLWGQGREKSVNEDDLPKPVEIYGESKLESEKILLRHRDDFDVVIFRAPPIIGRGRLGTHAILFEFILEGRRVWVPGGGGNRQQFIYVEDLVEACIKAIAYQKTDVFNVGADNVTPLKEVYKYLICKAGTKAKVVSLPRGLALWLLKIASWLKISPLGPYHNRMLGESFIFDTTKIKEKLDWRPTLSNGEMLFKAYEYYRSNLSEIRKRTAVSANHKAVNMGVFKVLKWLS